MTIGSHNSLVLSVLTSTATPLTFATGTLALVVALQRGQRRWAVAFIVLVLLSAYSPVLFAWVLIARTPLYVPETFTVNLPVLFLIDLLPQIFAVILAVVVLIYVYGLRDGRRSARHSEAQDETLQIERN
jgi:formate hydrogenlyase subunit 3/multisubunit Na+/H+ antiporter MnhD subunit